MFTLTTAAAEEEEEAFPEFFGLVSVAKKGRTSACGHVNRFLLGGTYDTQDVPGARGNQPGMSDYVSMRCPFVFNGLDAVGTGEKRPKNSGEFWSTISVLALRIAPHLLEYLEIHRTDPAQSDLKLKSELRKTSWSYREAISV